MIQGTDADWADIGDSHDQTNGPASFREPIIPLIKSRNRLIQTFPKPARRQ